MKNTRPGAAVEGPTFLARWSIESQTLQRHLIRNEAPNVGQKRIFVIDESSLTSTRQMNEFFHRLQTPDRVLLVGDTQQHEAVEAGRPYKQLQEAGMQTARLGEIVRQKDPSLKEAVEQLARGDVFGGVASLGQHGRVHEIVNSQERFSAIAREYSRNPEGTLVISPDNESRRELNAIIHREMQNRGEVSKDEHKLRVLESRQELTGADRQWAGQYEAGDVLRYSRGSKTEGIAPGDYARVTGVDPKENRITIKRETGSTQTYDPRRLSGVSVHRETEREFSKGDRVQFTAPSRELQVANRDLGTIEQLNSNGEFRIRMDSGSEVRFNIREHPHLDHGYAVTSHSSQGQTAQRVLIHVDTEKSELLVNNRFAYVSVSRAQHDVQIYTNDGSKLPRSLSRESCSRTAIDAREQLDSGIGKIEPNMTCGEGPNQQHDNSLGVGLA